MEPPLDPLAEYTSRFAKCFRRRDQARWLEVYLRGLLDLEERKNPESLARSLPGAEADHAASIAQSLQNFVNQSPWGEQDLWRRHHAYFRERLGGRPVAAVVEEVGFLKQGTHSVGVQRQLWAEHGKKLNCQLAVVLYAAGEDFAFPLGMRLYLPRAWTNAPERLEAAGVPNEQQAFASKSQIALELLNDAWASGFQFDLVLGRGLSGSSLELYEELARREQACLFEVSGERLVADWDTQAVVPVKELPSSPWPQTPGVQWASVALPEAGQPRRPWQALVTDGNRYHLGRLGRDFGDAHWRRARHAHDQALACQQHLRLLGLDHFEGRSWRGFHHHVCLVALAHGYVVSQRRS